MSTTDLPRVLRCTARRDGPLASVSPGATLRELYDMGVSPMAIARHQRQGTLVLDRRVAVSEIHDLLGISERPYELYFREGA